VWSHPLLVPTDTDNRETLRGMRTRESDRVDSVRDGAEAVWHSNGVTFYSGIIRDITARK